MNTASRVISDAYLHEQQRLHQNPRYGRASIGYAPRIRLVTHLDVDDEGVRRTIDALRQFAA